jgi:hypothetical protein
MFEPWTLAEGEELGSNILQIAQRSSPNGRETQRMHRALSMVSTKGNEPTFIVGHIVPLTLDEFQCAVLLEDDGSGFCMFLVDFAIGGGDGCDKSIDSRNGFGESSAKKKLWLAIWSLSLRYRTTMPLPSPSHRHRSGTSEECWSTKPLTSGEANGG